MRILSLRSGRIAAPGLLLAAILVAAPGATAYVPAPRHTTSPALGSKRFPGPGNRGFGHAHPREIFNGGDPSGDVSAIHWTRWGAATARGRGKTSIFKPTGGFYDTLVLADLRAKKLGHCTKGGRRAYKQLWIRVPDHPGGPMGKWQLWAGAKTICRPFV
jgi:hypothetical protein